jgi:small subunit ribosomal protein S2
MTRMPIVEKNKQKEESIKEMFKVGAHFGYGRSRRHPSIKPFIFGFKNKTALLNLEKTFSLLQAAEDYVRNLAAEGGKMILVGNKHEARLPIKKAAAEIDALYVAERWIGGIFTNFSEIKKRLKRLEEIKAQEVSGELLKYTKKERGLIAKEKRDLERFFGGIQTMEKLPQAIFVVDSKEEMTAVKEAKKLGITVISLSNSDCDINEIDYPIIGNDSQAASITFFVNRLVVAYKEGLKKAPTAVESDK